jgi:hypothetical protein
MKRFLAFVFVLSAFALRLAALDLYVAPNGNDANPGTAARPFSTVARARDAIRALKSAGGLPSGGVTVWLDGGEYNQGGTLVFDSRDSGTASSPISYASLPGTQARITGAAALDPSWFALVDGSSPLWNRLDAAARGKVYAVNLAAHGITNFGTFRPRGFSLQALAPMELFVAGQPMTLARWPNRDDPLARTASAPSATQITYAGSRQDRWVSARDAWLHGFSGPRLGRTFTCRWRASIRRRSSSLLAAPPRSSARPPTGPTMLTT